MSDIDAFDAVISARTVTDVVGVTIAVHGVSRPAPGELLAIADLRLGGAHAVGRWLAALARRLEGGSASPGSWRSRPRHPRRCAAAVSG